MYLETHTTNASGKTDVQIIQPQGVNDLYQDLLRFTNGGFLFARYDYLYGDDISFKVAYTVNNPHGISLVFDFNHNPVDTVRGVLDGLYEAKIRKWPAVLNGYETRRDVVTSVLFLT